MRNLFFSAIFLFSSSIHSLSQSKGSDIWMVNMNAVGGKITLAKPVNITNGKGTNTQPVISPDGKFIFFTGQADSSTQTDIYKYQISSKLTIPFTNTPEQSEQAAAFMPDGKNLSFIINERGSQRLWKLPLKVAGTPELVMKEMDSIGHYCWMGKDSLAFYVLTDPPSLQVAGISTGTPKVIAQNVSSCIQRVPSRTPGKLEHVWVFVEKDAKKNLGLKSMYYGKKSKLTTQLLCPICIMPPGVENFALSKGGVFSFSGSKLYILYDDFSEAWSEVEDLAKYDIKNISYIAISADEKRMIIVNNK